MLGLIAGSSSGHVPTHSENSDQTGFSRRALFTCLS